MKQHSDDYKLTAVKYYLENDKPMRYVCNKIFKCKYQSLSKWKLKFQKEGKIIREESDKDSSDSGDESGDSENYSN